MTTECNPVPTWWTKKNYRKYLNVLIKAGVAGVHRLDRCPIVPEVEEAFTFKDVKLSYGDGIGFEFIYDIPVKVGYGFYHVIYDRVFFYNKIEDTTRLQLTGLMGDIYATTGFVKFPRKSCGLYDPEEWVRTIVGEKKDEDC